MASSCRLGRKVLEAEMVATAEAVAKGGEEDSGVVEERDWVVEKEADWEVVMVA